jgi:hypothetical protein
MRLLYYFSSLQYNTLIINVLSSALDRRPPPLLPSPIFVELTAKVTDVQANFLL